ncbi:MAG: hypothetical protein KJ069_30875 [Anaerolineae bacterium]|nr:hypothetical protein [Anaerolineae bacterium]
MMWRRFSSASRTQANAALKSGKEYTGSHCNQFSAEKPQTTERLHSKVVHNDKVVYRREFDRTRPLTKLDYAA